MSTTDDTTTTDAQMPDQLPDAVDADRLRRDRELYDEYRSLYRVSPSNEAAACDTVAECRDVINKETYRENPRGWVIALVNNRIEEVRDGD
jgi:hypothetical protein